MASYTPSVPNRNRYSKYTSAVFDPNFPLNFSPILWLDAKDASTLTVNGSNVSQWNDKSGNSNHAVQGTMASQPSYSATDFNGKPTIAFSSAASLVNTGLTSTLPQTIFIVAKVNVEIANNAQIVVIGNTGGMLIYSNVIGGQAAIVYQFSTSSFLVTTWTVPRSLAFTIESSGSVNGYVGGVFTGNAILTGAVPYGGYALGCIPAPASDGAVISEVVLMNGKATVPQVQAFANYTLNKWGA